MNLSCLLAPLKLGFAQITQGFRQKFSLFSEGVFACFVEQNLDIDTVVLEI